MTPRQIEFIKFLISSIGGGVLVKLIDWLANRGKNKADEIKTLQDFWHDEFERLENEVKDLRKAIKGRDATIEEITTKYRELQTDYQKLQRLLRSRDKKICEQDGIIESLSNRIKELEDLMRKYGIDPDKGKEA